VKGWAFWFKEEEAVHCFSQSTSNFNVKHGISDIFHYPPAMSNNHETSGNLKSKMFTFLPTTELDISKVPKSNANSQPQTATILSMA
jgi:hypothetical protein